MARAPVQGTVSSSTVVQPVGSQAIASILTRAQQGIAQLQFTRKDVEDPAKLFELLHRLQSNLLPAIRDLARNPLLGGNLLQGWTFTPGQTQYLSHRLGHAYRGWFCVRAQTNAWSGVEAALPSGVTSAQLIAITSANAGTYDFWVF